MCLRLLQVVVFGLLLSRASLAVEPAADASRAIDLALEVVDLVQAQHFDPPVRQQMLLDGIRSLYRRLERPLPGGMGRRVSALADKDQERAFLLEVISKDAVPAGEQPVNWLIEGMLTGVPGNASFVPAKEAEVQDQLRGNRYVGIGIALGADKDTGLAVVHPFPQGVAYQAGIRDDDQIVEIDGVPIKGKKLTEIVDMLRGPEATTVHLVVRRSTEAEPLSFNLRRSVVRFETVVGYQKNKDGAWDYLAADSHSIGYAHLDEIRASTVQELRLVEQRLRPHKPTGIILDLRSNFGGNFHDSLLLADALLPEGVIGRERSVRGESEFKSAPDCLFRDLPMAVLINSETRREAEWLAAALKDLRQAVLVGTSTAGLGYSTEHLSLPSGRGAVELWTKVLLRANGSDLLHRDSPLFNRAAVFDPESPLPAVMPRRSKPRGLGVAPDVEVNVSAVSERNASGDRPKDPQLEAAIRALRAK